MPKEPGMSDKPVVNISIITPKPECFTAFMALQLAQHRSLRGQVDGLIGGRLFRSRQDRDVVLVTMFESEVAALRFSRDERFTDHMARIRPLLERAVPGVYEVAYEVGSL
jgi:heme-degrading monooxygenase HmoA